VSNKEMLQHAWAMLQCRACMSKAGNVTPLTFLLDRLVTLCQSVGVLYQKGQNSTHAWPPSPVSCEGDEGDRGTRELCVGEYNVDAPGGWYAPMRTLLLLQLQQLQRMLKATKDATVVGGFESLLRRLQLADARLMGLYPTQSAVSS
jgi:hypothetical protein